MMRGSDKFRPPPPSNPDGRKNFYSNHLEVHLTAGTRFYEYSVCVYEEDGFILDNEDVRKGLVDKVLRRYSEELLIGNIFAYDGQKSLYTSQPLAEEKLEFEVNHDDSCAFRDGNQIETRKRHKKAKTFIVELTYGARIVRGPNTQKIIQILDILFQKLAPGECLLDKKSVFYNHPNVLTDIGEGVVAVRGHHNSFHQTVDGISLNIDVATTVTFKQGPVLDFLLRNQGVQEPQLIDWEKATTTLRNVKVKNPHSNMVFKIIGLSDIPRSELPWLDVGKPNCPCLLPIEICSIVSLQRYTKGLSDVQIQSLAEISRQEPFENSKDVLAARRKYGLVEDATTEYLAGWGVKVKRPLKARGRVLDPPLLKVGRNGVLFPDNGKWNFSGKQFISPRDINCWAIVNFSGIHDPELISSLIRCGKNVGMVIKCPSMFTEEPQHQSSDPETRVGNMCNVLLDKEPQLEFLLCLLPKSSPLYGPWAKKCLIELGIPTQCLSPNGSTDEYVNNVLIKINSKLGGINSLLEKEHSGRIPGITSMPTMIMGLVVSHGSLGQPDVHSIAAAVGSQGWPSISRYRAALRAQLSKADIIDSLFDSGDGYEDRGIMRELLEEFYKSSKNVLPDNIIIFRDGVSDTDLGKVINIEMDKILTAYRRFQSFLYHNKGGSAAGVYTPKFTVIVVEKNHHTRFYLKSPVQNVLPGTVVDRVIVHPDGYNFYMCSHAGMTGTTSCPSHYHVLRDDIGFSPDDLQALVHSLCYISRGSTTATSVVAPVAYAHLAAEQAKHFLEFEVSSGTSLGGDKPMPMLPSLHENVADSMFFL